MLWLRRLSDSSCNYVWSSLLPDAVPLPGIVMPIKLIFAETKSTSEITRVRLPAWTWFGKQGQIFRKAHRVFRWILALYQTSTVKQYLEQKSFLQWQKFSTQISFVFSLKCLCSGRTYWDFRILKSLFQAESRKVWIHLCMLPPSTTNNFNPFWLLPTQSIPLYFLPVLFKHELICCDCYE